MTPKTKPRATNAGAARRKHRHFVPKQNPQPHPYPHPHPYPYPQSLQMNAEDDSIIGIAMNSRNTTMDSIDRTVQQMLPLYSSMQPPRSDHAVPIIGTARSTSGSQYASATSLDKCNEIWQIPIDAQRQHQRQRQQQQQRQQSQTESHNSHHYMDQDSSDPLPAGMHFQSNVPSFAAAARVSGRQSAISRQPSTPSSIRSSASSSSESSTSSTPTIPMMNFDVPHALYVGAVQYQIMRDQAANQSVNQSHHKHRQPQPRPLPQPRLQSRLQPQPQPHSRLHRPYSSTQHHRYASPSQQTQTQHDHSGYMLVRKVSFTAADAVLDSVTEEQIWNIIQENEQGASHALQEATATAATMTTTTTNTGTSTSATAATVQPRSPVQQAMASTTATTTATATATTTSTQRRAEPTISHPQQLITPRGSTDAGKDVVASANGAPQSPLPATAAMPNQQHLALISTPPPSGYVSEKSATPSPTNPLSQRGSNENITSRNEPQQSIQLSLQQSLQQTAQLSQVPVAQAPSHVTVSSSVLESDTPAEQDISNALGITYKPAAIKPPFGSMQTPFTQATQLPVVQVRPVSSKNSRSVEAPQTPSILSNQQQHQQQQQQTVRSSTPVGNSLISPGEQFKASSPEQAVSLSAMMANSMSASMHQLSNHLQHQQQQREQHQTIDTSPAVFNDEQLPPVEQNTTTDSGGSAAVNVSDTALDLDQVCDYENENSNANANANANNERANETVPSTVNRRPKRILRRRPINLNVPATTTSSRQHTQPPSGPLPPLPPPPPPPPPPNRTNFPQNLPETPQFREFTRNDNPHGIRTLEKILNVATYKLATADGSKSGQLTGDFHSNVKSVGGCISSEGNGNPALKQVRDATHQYFVRSRALKHQRDGTQPTEEPVDLESTAYSKLGTKLFAVPSGLLNTFRRFAQERGVIGGLLMGHRFQNGLSVVTHLVLPPKNIPTRSPGIPRIEWHELLERNIPVQSIVTPTTQENGQQNSYLLTNLVLGWIASTNAEGGIKAADWTPLHESRSSQTWSISKRISKNGIGFILRVPQSPSSPSSLSTRPQATTAANRIFNDPMIPNVEDYYFTRFRNDSRAIDKVSRLKLDNGYDYPVVVVNIDYKVFDTSQLSQPDLGALLASGPLSNTNGSVVRAV